MRFSWWRDGKGNCECGRGAKHSQGQEENGFEGVVSRTASKSVSCMLVLLCDRTGAFVGLGVGMGRERGKE